MKRSIGSVLSNVCFGIGGIWALAAALKITFGFAVHFPLLPRIGLEEVDVVTSLVVAVGLFTAGAVLRRYDVRREQRAEAEVRKRAVFSSSGVSEVGSTRRFRTTARSRQPGGTRFPSIMGAFVSTDRAQSPGRPEK